jgi:hypothetical protein
MSPYGYSDAAWQSAKVEAKAALVEIAGTPAAFISYSELVARILPISFEVRDPRFGICSVRSPPRSTPPAGEC